MPSLKIDHQRCTQCRMCYVVCREIDLNAVYVALEPLHRIEIDIDEMHLSRLHRLPDVLPGGRFDRRGRNRPLAGPAPARSLAELMAWDDGIASSRSLSSGRAKHGPVGSSQ